MLLAMSMASARPSSPALARFVESFHFYDNEPQAMTFERSLPSGNVDLMVNLFENEFRTYREPDVATVCRTHGAVLGGPRSQSTVIDTLEQRCLVTVSFHFGGAAAFFKTPLSETQNHLVELDQLWGRDGAVLRERLLETRTPEAKFQILEAVLLKHLVRTEDPDLAMPAAARALERGMRVSEVSSRLGFLPKTFLRRFEKQTGLTPKRFSRLRRFQRLLRSIPDPATADWAELAVDHGYVDQAHLIHDFRELAGMTPAVYRPLSSEAHNHVPVAASDN